MWWQRRRRSGAVTVAELKAYRQEQLAHPTKPERAAAAALDTLGISYTAQGIIPPYIVDFFLADGPPAPGTVLEVYGCGIAARHTTG